MSAPLEALGRELAARLALTRPLVCVDLEATGLWPAQDRIVQIAVARIFPAGSVTTWQSLVQPGRPIPAGATAVHGITDAMVAGAPTFAEIAPLVASLLRDADLTGYNVERFDRRLLAAEFARAGLDDATATARVVDAYTILVRSEPRTLDAALRLYGVAPPSGARRAHDAASDVEATLAVLAAQVRTYTALPQTVEALHDWLHPRDASWIDAQGRIVWRDGTAIVTFGPRAGTSLAELSVSDREFLEWVLRKDFADDVKTLVRDALDGRFPVPPSPTGPIDPASA